MRTSRGTIWKKEKALLAAAMFILLIAGCTNHNYYMSKKMLREQMSSQESLQTKPLSLLVPTSGPILGINFAYDSNDLPKILCLNKEDQKVYVSVNQNTILMITDNKGKSHKIYLDTIYLKNEVLYWQESVPMDAIDKIEVFTEKLKGAPAK